MEVSTDLVLRELHMDPMEKFMDEYVGTASELRGLFKIHTSTAVDSNLQQIICSTAKEWYEKSEGKLKLSGLNFTADEQISCWVNRTEETYRKLGMPMTVEGFIKLNDTKNQFNFLNLWISQTSMRKLKIFIQVRTNFGKERSIKKS